MTTNSPAPLKLFYCYAHEDKTLRDELDAHLNAMKRRKLIEVWYDRDILAGTILEHEIETHLNTSHIILLLVSAYFLNSDYCYSIEMQKALKRHTTGKARVIPIILRPVDWEDTPFSKLPVLPTGSKPVTSWSDPHEAFEDISKGLRQVVNELYISLKTKEQWLDEGITLYNKQRYNEAISVYNEAIALDPTYVHAYYPRGTAYSELKEYQKAIADYTQALALALDPSRYVTAYHSRGTAYSELKEYQKAIADYTQAIALDSSVFKDTGAVAYHSRGNAYFYLEEYHKAIADYDQAIALDGQLIGFYGPGIFLPKPPPSRDYQYHKAIAHHDRGNAYFHLEEYEKAIADYDQTLAFNPDNTSAKTWREEAVRRLKRRSRKWFPS